MFKKANVVLSSVMAAFILLLIVSCGDDPVSSKVPVLTTVAVSEITQTMAQCGFSVRCVRDY